MNKVLGYLKKYWYFAILSPLFMILEVSMDLVQPSLMSQIVDDGITQGNISLIVELGIQMLIFTVVGCCGGVLSGVFGNLAAQNFSNDLRKDAFSKVMKMSFQQTDKFTIGSLVTRLTNDITACQDFVGMALRMMVRTLMQFVGGIVMVLHQCDFRIYIAVYAADTDSRDNSCAPQGRAAVQRGPGQT